MDNALKSSIDRVAVCIRGKELRSIFGRDEQAVAQVKMRTLAWTMRSKAALIALAVAYEAKSSEASPVAVSKHRCIRRLRSTAFAHWTKPKKHQRLLDAT